MEKNTSVTTRLAANKISRRTLLSAGLASSFFLSNFQSLAAEAKIDSAIESQHADEDGYRAWLRYQEIDDKALLQNYRRELAYIVVPGESETAQIMRDELTNSLSALLGVKVPAVTGVTNGTLLVGKTNLPAVRRLLSDEDCTVLGPEGFVIRSVQVDSNKIIVIASQTDVGTLYGVFAFLRHLQTHKALNNLSIQESPINPLRVVTHGDTIDGDVVRGYGGKSIWHWSELPEHIDPRLIDYARLNASIGINGVVLNNVNSGPKYLDATNIKKAAALANIFRPLGIKIYLCANFAAPRELDHLSTADPLNPEVIKWWQSKADEIYKAMPDFGGFLVKANSEDIPGPQDYGRSHADGANMLANALAPHGGIVMWRAFVYTVGNQDQDRVKRAYLEFKPLDGKFAKNVILQVKNGPLDFQPREPFHPLFGAMPKSRLMAELQITQEYLGQGTHLVYLASCWEEFFKSNTQSNGAESSVAQVIESLPKPNSGGINGNANVGSDRNWCGHHFAQSNWFSFGRLAWNSTLSASGIADDWIKMTWSNSPKVAESIRDIMLESYEAYVNYTMPLGLHHMVGGDHYAPLPEGEGDPRGIYHHASADGIGYDRTRHGSDAVDEYNPPLNDVFNDPAKCPERYLLWFHHLPWDHRMASGRTLWQELCFKYDSGIKSARDMETRWASLAASVDERRHKEVAIKLRQQAKDAEAWSNKCLTYFRQYSKLPRV